MTTLIIRDVNTVDEREREREREREKALLCTVQYSGGEQTMAPYCTVQSLFFMYCVPPLIH